MIRRLLLVICLLAACAVTPAGAAPAATSPAATSKIKRPAASAKRASAPAKKSTARKPAASPDSTARLAGGPRRLEDIHIEGEIPAPQVLFVTARDQRRFTRFHHQRYLKTSAQVGETTPLPTRVALKSRPPTPAGAP